jgi:hypothetical protein
MEKRRGVDASCPSRRSHDHMPAQHKENRGKLGCRIGVGETSADRAAVSNHAVGDEPDRFGQERANARHERRVLDVGLSGKRSHGHATVALIDGCEIDDPIDVDQVGGAGEPEVEQGHQRLATGQDLRIL